MLLSHLIGEEFDEVPLTYQTGETKLEPTLTAFQSGVLSEQVYTLYLMPSQKSSFVDLS